MRGVGRCLPTLLRGGRGGRVPCAPRAPRAGRGRVGTCDGDRARATGTGANVVEKFPPAAHTSCAFLAPWAHFFSTGGKRLPIDASQPASASGLESAVAARPTARAARAAAARANATFASRHAWADTLGELQRQHQIAGGRVGTRPRPAQGVGGGRVCRRVRVHASPHPSQLNATQESAPASSTSHRSLNK